MFTLLFFIQTTTALAQNPSAPVASNSPYSLCSGATTTLSVTVGAGETADWYDAASGGTLLASGSTTYLTGSLNSATTYYAEARDLVSGLVSASRTSVVVNVNPLPVTTITATAGSCTRFLYVPTSSSYLWNTGATTDAISVSVSGSYSVTVTNSYGCSANSGTYTFTAPDNQAPVITCYNEKVRQPISGSYVAVGTEFDPPTKSDNCTYNLSWSSTPAVSTIITENFSTNSWNTGHFMIGSTSGSASTGAYKSTANRGTLTTVANDFQPSATKILTVEATLTFSGGTGIAFIGTRSTGLALPGSSNEPSGVIMRIHNFNNGQTTVAGDNNNFGDTFYNSAVRVKIVDNGSRIIATFRKISTNTTYVDTVNNTSTTGGWKVVFSGDNMVSWDDISINYENPTSLAHATFPTGTTAVTWTITDVAGNTATCTNNVTVGLTPPANITVAADAAGCTATVASLGTPTYSGTGTITNDQTSSTFPQGVSTVTWTLTDSYGSTATATQTVTVNPQNSVSITNNTGSTTLNCTNTSISLTASGPSSYSWSGGLGTSADVSISTAGSYTVTGTDALGCTSTSAITITSNTTAPTASITNTSNIYVLTCSSSAISLTAGGGSSYQWSGGLGSNATVSITSPGTYTVTVTGSNGCTATESKVITQNFIASTNGNVQIGTGTSISSFFPVRSGWEYTYSQQIFTRTELQAQGVSGAQVISRLRLFVSSKSTESNWNDWDVYLANVVDSGFSTNTSFLPTSSMTLVFSGSFNPSSGHWQDLKLSTPFTWNGTGNLLVAINEKKSGLASPTFGSFSSATLSPRFRTIYYNSVTVINPSSISGGLPGSNSTTRNRIQFEMFPAGTCSGTPTGGTISGSPSCSNTPSSFALQLTGHSANSGIALQWQESSDSSTWSNVSFGGSASCYTTPTLSSKTYYRCVVICYHSASTATSSVFTAKVFLTPSIDAPADVTVAANSSGCEATGVSLGSASYPDNCSTATVTNDHPSTTYPLGVTTVTWTITDALGQTATAQQTVTVTNTVSASISTANTELTCALTSIDLTAGGGGTYQWSDALGSIGTVTVTSPATYTVTVTDAIGCTDTESITITQDANPAIFTLQPSSITQKTTPGIVHPAYSVAVSGGAGHVYQWYSNTSQSNVGGTVISGAQSTSYLPPTQTPGVLYYYCTVSTTNGCVGVSQPSGPLQVCGQ